MPPRTTRRGGNATTAAPVVPVSERREAILAIAAEIFSQKGFAATTVREIADAAGILSGSLYHHFDSKETMVDEIISKFINEMVVSYTKIVNEVADPDEALRQLIRTAFAAILPHQAAVTVAQNESHYLQQFDRFAYLADGYAAVERLWITVLRRGIAAGVFKADLDTKLTYLFMRDAIWVTVRWFKPGGRYKIDQLAENYIEFVLDGISSPPPRTRRSR
jgi:AcrR family transcriptional regulator